MKNRKLGLILLIPIIALTVALYGCQSKTLETTVATPAVSQATKVSYAGQDGKTALELLEASNQVIKDTSSAGVLVKSINGVSQTDKEFWLYDVNGAEPTVGADKYVTKSGDTISWTLKSF